YVIVGMLGGVQVSQEAVAQLTWKILERTIIAMFIVVILATTEELIFRVFLMRYLRWSAAPAVTIGAVLFSSLVFATSHNLTDPLAWLSPSEHPLFIGLFLLGILLCTAYIASGSF